MEDFLKQIIDNLELIIQALNKSWQIIAAIATAIAAIAAWYTVYQTRELEKDRELPIVMPISGNNLAIDNFSGLSFTVKNIGRGIAKNFYIYFGGYETKVYGGDRNIQPGEEEKNFRSQNYNIVQIKELLKSKPTKITMEFRYKDIHERGFKTTDMEYELSNGIYILNKENWVWKRLLKSVNYVMFFKQHKVNL